MLSALLSGTDAAVRIVDAAGTAVLERDASRVGGGGRFPILVEGEAIGWVEGDRVARAVAAVLSYACARETDKRSLAQEALGRYRELNLVYDLAARLSADLDAPAIVAIAEEEAGRLVPDGRGIFRSGAAGITGAVERDGVAEIVNDVASDPRASEEERQFAVLAAAPVTAHGTPLAVLSVASATPRDLTSGDLKLLTAVASIVGPVLDRARSRDVAGAALAGER
jgi:GAF domain-containing protein